MTTKSRKWRSGGRVAPKGKLTLTQAATILNRSRERVRQMAASGAFGPVDRPKPMFVFLDEQAVLDVAAKRAEIEQMVRSIGAVPNYGGRKE